MKDQSILCSVVPPSPGSLRNSNRVTGEVLDPSHGSKGLT